jgi:condensation enzyme
MGARGTSIWGNWKEIGAVGSRDNELHIDKRGSAHFHVGRDKHPMTAPLREPTGSTDQFLLSYPQELWCEGVQSGTFGPRFIATAALRLAGPIAIAALQAALDDLVVRHEVLRTTVVYEADPPYQQVHPPSSVPLHVQDLQPMAGRSRELIAEELLIEAERSTLDVNELPLMRATLSRFDDHDAVLTLVIHHSVSDGWSVQLIMRDLAAFYEARVTGEQPELPPAPRYREYAAWQRARITGRATEMARAYWRKKLDGARRFALPADRPVPREHSEPYSLHGFRVDTDVMNAAAVFAKETQSSVFMVLLAAFYVLAHQIAGTNDLVVNTITTGRGETRFYDTVGPFLNFLPLRTEIGECGTFREIVARTKRTCLEAYSYEIPVRQVERQAPDLLRPLEEPMNCDFILGFAQPLFNDARYQIGESSYPVIKDVLQDTATADMPGGAAWTMDLLQSGLLIGRVQFNPEEFDSNTVINWVKDYCRLVPAAISAPDGDWRALL